MIDLHIHSHFSDGSFSPIKVANLAAEAGLKSISLTDHDVVGGVRECESECERLGLEFAPGVELSTLFHERDLHILGYYIDINYKPLVDNLTKLRNARSVRAESVVGKLSKAGYGIDFEDVKEEVGFGSIGRVHIAKALVKKGVAPDVSDAFKYYLAKGKDFFVQKELLEVDEAVDLIRKSGGVVIAAHPAIDGVIDYLDELMEFGIDGLEAYHPNHTPSEVIEIINYAKRNNLLITGGTDFHGHNSKHGRNLGDQNVPDEHFTAMKKFKSG